MALIGLRVLLADDHPAYRAGLAAQLRHHGIDVVGDVANGAAAIESALELRPDVVLMDLNMPGVGGLEAIRRVTAEASSVRVLVLTVSAQHDDLKAAKDAGATGYLLKDAALDELLAALHTVAEGRTAVSPRIVPPPPAGVAGTRRGRGRGAVARMARPHVAALRLRRPRQQT